jgi:hypothetical protein
VVAAVGLSLFASAVLIAGADNAALLFLGRLMAGQQRCGVRRGHGVAA